MTQIIRSPRQRLQPLCWIFTAACVFCQLLSGLANAKDYVLDYDGTVAPSSMQIRIRGKNFQVLPNPEEELNHGGLMISVHPRNTLPWFKMLITLEYMECDPVYGSDSNLMIWEENGRYMQYCPNHSEKLLVSEGRMHVLINVGKFWNGTALIMATTYYAPYTDRCACDSDAFCCEPCQLLSEGYGYCLNRNMTEWPNYQYYCPCGMNEQEAQPTTTITTTPTTELTTYEPGPTRLPPVDDPCCDNLSMHHAVVMLYVALGIIIAIAIIYFVPFYCRRLTRRLAPEPAAPVRATVSRQNPIRTRQNSDFERPPPPYAPPDHDYFMKQVSIEDELPPPSYETIVKDWKV